ncbi:hypothetical protein A2716_01505 [candidate division WWE3 bacterium RIFCSPHIGHO2_01_FULL_40_23]|uniref:Type II secretion system protein GspG C-terminal domain-containing protein n=1 Tax=candidate division WWE3 bacterium RIFCSPLOWO2_01_FULL_41_18 TaxID=1802625 RepID=A0A1F4VDP6_UNCKA|nr:MAG: hypothetical protein A2716_01505 [candidate division WWE3 bacterium RIFCSPHIGHO2_01_FULL_40_23]OGC55406.1 MAG: hypothetical protein A3A78_00410 [candidate division WWE3 bacterium RIFCSPLOWO2_01_FULL_41_18]
MIVGNEKGYTLLELTVIFLLLGLIALIVSIFINPVIYQRKARDNVRLSDAVRLSSAIEEYVLNNESPPDEDDTMRYSNVIPEGNAGPVESSSSGWIVSDLSSYLTRLPIDPINDNTYRYLYQRSGSSYEVNVKLEYFTEKMEDDGGDNNGFYEVGTDLTIIN